MIRIRPGGPREAARGYARRTAHIDGARSIDDVWFMTPADTHPLSDDWLIPVAALIGMSLGEDVHIAGTVSERLLASIDEIQRVTVLRHDGLQRVGITAETVARTPRSERPRVLSCFSAGVDSFYTVLDPDERIDELLYVHGLEAYVGDERVLAYLLPQIVAAASELGRPLRLVETNWRSVIEPVAGHAYFVTVPMLFAIAYLMGSNVTRLLVPGTSDPYFPLEDPSSVRSYVGLWATEGLETMEHGHVSRFDKVRRLAESDIAMRRLRVCWERWHPVYNCGRCVKCVRTRVHLALAGAAERCETLPPDLPLDEIRNAEPETAIHRNYVEENIAEAEAQGLTDLAAALRAQRANGARRSLLVQARMETGRFLRRLHLSYRKRRFDASLRRLKREHGTEHLFTWLGEESPEMRR